jgi:hypothetical protein
MHAVVSHPSPTSAEFLTVTQVAELLQVSVRQVWYLSRDGGLTPARLIRRGNKRGPTRWRRADVLRYVDRLTAASAAGETVRA